MINYLLTILTGIIAVLGFILDAKDSNKGSSFLGLNTLRVFIIISIIISIGFSLWVQFDQFDEGQAKEAKANRKLAVELEKYSNDSLIHIKEQYKDSVNFASQKAVTDSNYLLQRHNDSLQLRLLQNQILYGMSIDNIKNKSRAIITNLSSLENKLVEGNKELYYQQQRQSYPLQENNPVNLLLTIQFLNKRLSKDIEENYFGDLEIYMKGTTPLSIQLQQFFKNLIIDVNLPSLSLENADGASVNVISKGMDINKENGFTVFYDNKYKVFTFTCRRIALKMISGDNRPLSLLDCENTPFSLNIFSSSTKPPYSEYRFPENFDGAFLGSDSAFTKFQINFINKKRTIKYEKWIVPEKNPIFEFEAFHFQEGFGHDAF